MELEKAKEKADSFSWSYQSLKGHLCDLDGRMRGTVPIQSNSGEVKQQLENHKVQEKEWELNGGWWVRRSNLTITFL